MKKLAKIVGILICLLVLGLGGFIAATWAPDRPVAELTGRWAPPPSNFLSMEGMNVHFRDEGVKTDPVPIVLLHGTGASLHTWEGWTRRLSSHRRVISLDLPGFGLTGPFRNDDYRIERYVSFLDDFLTRLDVTRCVLAGNSFGGRVAWETALARPAKVACLVLVDASGYPPHSTSVPIGFRIARIPVLNRLGEYSLPRRLVESSLRNVYGDPARIPPEAFDRYYDLTRREGNRRALGLRMQQVVAGPNAYRIREVKIPTLILWGRQDRLIPVDDATRFNTDIAGSTLVIFDDLGHLPQEEDPERTVAVVKQFLGVP